MYSVEMEKYMCQSKDYFSGGEPIKYISLIKWLLYPSMIVFQFPYTFNEMYFIPDNLLHTQQKHFLI